MKHAYLLLAFLWAGLFIRPAQAQAPDSLSQKLSSIFAHVDKSQVPTGYLYEAGVRLLEPRYYNGVLADSNLTDMDVLRYLHVQLRSCRVQGSDTLPSVQTLNARLKAAVATGGGAIPLVLRYERYASLRPDAVSQNLLTVQNEQVYDVPGRSQSSYQTNTLFVAAPDLTYSRTGTVSFVLRRNLYLTGSGAVPTSLALDFGDGQGYRPASWGKS